MTTATAAKEAWLRSGQEVESGFSDFDNRIERYKLFWAYYSNDMYDDWAAYKATRGLYRHIRQVYNPMTRLADFYVNKIWGGQLDFDGLGGAIPIEADNPNIMPALAQLWQRSNWGAKKNLAVLWGSVMGDMVIKVVDEAPGEGKRGQVYLQVMHPRQIKNALFDYRGFVQSVVIEYVDSEPGDTEGTYVDFTYREEINKKTFKTFKNNEPFDYFGYGAEWDNGYGFVPLVISPHKDIGLDWGLSVGHDGRVNLDELNDQVSVFSDRMRKGNNPPWLFSGVSKPKDGDIDLSVDTATTTDQTRRQKDNLLYAGDPQAKAQALVSDVGLAQTLEYIVSLQGELEAKYPELEMLASLREQEASGVALRIKYQPVIDNVTKARGNYDVALVRVQQMALSIGGMRGYFPGFGLESYEAGNEEHRIGDRPVLTAIRDLEAIKMASELGVPAPRLWAKLGLDFSSEELEEMEAEVAGMPKDEAADMKGLMDVAKEHLEAAKLLAEGGNA